MVNTVNRKFTNKNKQLVSSKSKMKLRQSKTKRKIKNQEDILKTPLAKNDNKKCDKVKKKIDHDIRKAPELKVQNDEVNNTDDFHPNNADIDEQRVAIKIKVCFSCDTRHVQELCPLQNALCIVLDSMSTDKWIDEYKPLYDEKNQISNYSFAYLSLPSTLLEFDNSNTPHGISVFSKCEINEFTQFGPLIGNSVKEVDISEDNSMRDLWEIFSDSGNIYLSTENVEESNWIRFIRPATAREHRNITAISKENKLYFITIKLINKGEELLYWQDDSFKTNKKKMEKTSNTLYFTYTHT